MSEASDARYVVIDGPRWRATDPSIPEPLRTELVLELMAARRAVRAAGDDDEATARARARVHDAKVALGERGHPWWEPASSGSLEARLTAAVRTLLRHRSSTSSICPSDVARVAGGTHWRSAMEPARTVARRLARDGEVRLTRGSDELDPEGELKGPIRIRRSV